MHLFPPALITATLFLPVLVIHTLKCLQVVQNAAAKLLTSVRSHVTPILNNDNNL